MLLETAEFRLPGNPDRVVMYVPGLKGSRARHIANAAVAEARRKMPKMSGYSANRMQPVYGQDYFGIRWADCLVPGTKVLRGDWQWVPVEKLQVGDDLIGFDEEVIPAASGSRGRGRRYRTSQVVATMTDMRECVEVEFDDGTTVTGTKNHPWLALRRRSSSARQWIRSEDLEPGDRLGVYLDAWSEAETFDEGWLAGLLDGEGSYAHSPSKTKQDSCSGVFTFAQNAGPVLDRALGVLDRLGIQYKVAGKKRSGYGVREDCMTVRFTGGFAEHARLLGSLRPTRLLPKLRHEGRYMQALRERTVVAVREVEPQEVVVMETSTGTYLAEGMASHNSYVWFQDHGIRAFTMNNLAGKTIPMWVDDPTGIERQKNPKAKIRTTLSGKTQVLIFRRAAEKGKRIVKYRRNKATGQREVVSDKPASYPGAPGRIGVREAGAPLTTPGRVAGAVARGNVGVRWRHPGIAPRLFLNNAMTLSAQRYGIVPVRIYIGDQRWSQFVHGMERAS